MRRARAGEYNSARDRSRREFSFRSFFLFFFFNFTFAFLSFLSFLFFFLLSVPFNMPNIREHSSRTRAHNSAKSMTVLPHRFAMHYTHREHNSDILYSIIKPVHSVQPLLLLLLLLLLCPVNVGAVLLPLLPSCRVPQDRGSRSS